MIMIMKMFVALPQEIRDRIAEYDPYYREQFSALLRDAFLDAFLPYTIEFDSSRQLFMVYQSYYSSLRRQRILHGRFKYYQNDRERTGNYSLLMTCRYHHGKEKR